MRWSNRMLVVLVVGCGPTVSTDGGSGDASSESGTTTSATGASTVASTQADTTSSSSTTVADVTSADEDVSLDGPIFDDFFIPTDVAPHCTEAEALGSQIGGWVWVPDLSQGTIAKIDHTTLQIVARYATSSAADSQPRTVSVSRNGDVIVSNRGDLLGVTMLRANVDDCLEPSNTSTGPDDVLPWPDGCVAWSSATDYDVQGAVAWTGGTFDPVACRYEDADVWSSGNLGQGLAVNLLDGESGVIEETVFVAGAFDSASIVAAGVDAEGNFWGTNGHFGPGLLVRVDRETLEGEAWSTPFGPWGLAIDRDQQVWVCRDDLARFDYALGSWQIVDTDGVGYGCGPGLGDMLWSAGPSLRAFDIDSFMPSAAIELPETTTAVAVDFDGYLWATQLGGPELFRVDPVTGTVDTIVGFATFTEGDLTGAALALVHGQL